MKKYTVNPDGTVTFDNTIETGNNENTKLSKETLENMSEYDTHKLFK